jgi:uncharacterized protein (UPF0371 family)
MSIRAFDQHRYLQHQLEAFTAKIAQAPTGEITYIEFGGKVYDDQHAARVLPGFHPDAKLTLIAHLSITFEIVMVVSARDLLKPRIRGDSQLFYDQETVRVVQEIRGRGVNIQHGVLSMFRSDFADEEQERLGRSLEYFKQELGITFLIHYAIPAYPSPIVLREPRNFLANQKLNNNRTNILVFSPGGGSAKFGVCLSELVTDFLQGRNSFFVKFETFPVFDLPPYHPVNKAFIAATADLGNITLPERSGGLTTYDKDAENFILLSEAVAQYCPNQETNPLARYTVPSDMGVNALTTFY